MIFNEISRILSVIKHLIQINFQSAISLSEGDMRSDYTGINTELKNHLYLMFFHFA